jgi:hypothetical protein
LVAAEFGWPPGAPATTGGSSMFGTIVVVCKSTLPVLVVPDKTG